MDTDQTILQVQRLLDGAPAFLAGSLCAAKAYSNDSFGDVDLFVPNEGALFAVTQLMLDKGCDLDTRHERVWARWLKYGVHKWHTNSVRLHQGGTEFNVVYKLVDGHPTTSLGQVVESFDFGLLAIGYDCGTRTWHDYRRALFPGYNVAGALPLMPNKRAAWRDGFISQYNGLRESVRYVKYHDYGYDLSLVKEDLLEGYWNAAAYLTQKSEADKQQLGKIYEVIAGHIEKDDLDQIRSAASELVTTDALDDIMQALE